LERNRGF